MNKRRKSVLITVFVLLCISTLIPGILLLIFEFPKSVQNLTNAWKTEGTLAYFGAVISALGALGLGFAVFWQTEIHKRDNEFSQKASTNRPFFLIKNISYADSNSKNIPLQYETNRYLFCENKFHKISIELENVGEGLAINLVSPEMMWCEPSLFNSSENRVVLPNNTTKLIFIPEVTIGEKYSLEFEIYYQNLLGFTYSQTILIDLAYNLHCYINGEEFHDCQLNIFPISAQIEHRETGYCLNKGQYFNHDKHEYIKLTHRKDEKP